MAGGEKIKEREEARLEARVLTLESKLCKLTDTVKSNKKCCDYEKQRVDTLFDQVSYLQLAIDNLRSDLNLINERYKDDTKVLHDYYKEAPFTKE